MTPKPQKIEGGWKELDKLQTFTQHVFQNTDEVKQYDVVWVRKDEVKELISQIRASERQRCVEACEYGKYKHVISEEHKVVNQALDEAIQAIDQSKPAISSIK